MYDNILMIGGAGFVGTHMQRYFFELGKKVTITGVKDKKLQNYHMCNVCNKEDVRKVIKICNPKIVIFLAAVLKPSREREDYNIFYETNVVGFKNVLDVIIEEQVKIEQCLLFSSGEVYGNCALPASEKQITKPISFYSLSKVMAEQVALLYFSLFNIPVTIIRPSIIYGEGQSERFFLTQAISALTKNQDFSMTLGEQKRDYIHINDVIKACDRILSKQEFKGEIVNISFGHSYKIIDIVEALKKKLHSTSNILNGLLPYRKNEMMEYSISNTKIKKRLNWIPENDIIEGIED